MKELKDMSLEELWQLFPIILKEHNLEYKDWYKEEEQNITKALQDLKISRINHIGSTAVKGLIAKSIVDILLELSNGYDMNLIVTILQKNDWLVMSKDDNKQTVSLNKGYTKYGFSKKVFHLHIKPYGDHNELYFRDYLQKYNTVANDYVKLKLSLLKEFKNNRDGYTSAKTNFINEVTAKAKQEFKGRYLPINI